MGKLVSDELWSRVEPILPKHPPGRTGGRPRIDDRVCLVGIMMVLKTGMNWHDVPEEIGASGQTCWRRMREWTEVGVWDELHRILLDELNRHGKLDLSLAVVDSSSLRALKGGRRSARTRRTAAGAARSITS
jgi:transposase